MFRRKTFELAYHRFKLASWKAGLDPGLDWTGLDWTGLDWTFFRSKFFLEWGGVGGGGVYYFF